MNGEKKNSPFDVVILIFVSLLLGVGFGFAIYFVFVYIILPLAVEFIPALDTYLTRLGREHDAEEIYSVIYQSCALLGMIPAICAANTVVRRRMRLFIHDTSCVIKRRDGFKYHLKNHLFYDIAFVAVMTVAGLAIYLFDRGVVGFSPFHILYCRLGVLPALLISLVIVSVSQLLGIVCAQNYWRAEYFFGD